MAVGDRPARAAGGSAPEGTALGPEARADHARQARNRRWAKWAGTAVAVVALLRLAADFLLPARLPACDASEVRDTLKTLAQAQGVDLNDILAVETTASESDHRSCTARFVRADGEATAIYRIYRQDRKPVVRLVEMQPL